MAANGVPIPERERKRERGVFFLYYTLTSKSTEEFCSRAYFQWTREMRHDHIGYRSSMLVQWPGQREREEERGLQSV
jgi:hypothetical protein